MTKQTPALLPLEKKFHQSVVLPLTAIESGALHEWARSKKRLNAATLHFFELLRRA